MPTLMESLAAHFSPVITTEGAARSRRWLARQIWFSRNVLPRTARGEYVPADEQHPPVTAAELRGRAESTVG